MINPKNIKFVKNILYEQVARAADDGAGVVLDEDVARHQVGPAVRAADVEVGGQSLHVETVQHEQRRLHLRQFLKNIWR